MRECYICGAKEGIEKHHINWHHNHDEPSNRVFLCARCHSEVHKIGYLSREELEAIRQKVKAREPGRK